MVGKGWFWFWGGPGLFGKCQWARRAPAGSGILAVGCPILHHMRWLKGSTLWRLVAEVMMQGVTPYRRRLGCISHCPFKCTCCNNGNNI